MTTNPYAVEDPVGPNGAVKGQVAQWIVADLRPGKTVDTTINDGTNVTNNALDLFNTDPARWERCIPTC